MHKKQFFCNTLCDCGVAGRLKVAVIGGGGVRSMFLAKSIANRARDLNITELVFMDNDSEKLNIYGKMASEVAKRLAPHMKFSLTEDPIEAVSGADYVITTIRAGGDKMRCRDERIALDMGYLGQETTGAAGFSFAMRSIPALSQYCEYVKKYAKPHCKVFNFTNPAGVVSQTLRDMGYDFTFGICDAPAGMLRSFEEFLGLPLGSTEAFCYGLNHLSFFNEIISNGKNVVPKLLESDNAYKQTDLRYFNKEDLLKKQFIPNEYLYYFYEPQNAVQNILNAPMTRGEQIEKINREMTAALKNINVEHDFEKALEIFEHYYGMRENSYMASETGEKRDKKYKFDIYAPDDGGYAGVALGIIDALIHKTEKKVIACVPNKNKALDFLCETDTVEISCKIIDGEAVPLSPKIVSEENKELILAVKEYERLASKAIRLHDRQSAVEALTVHPLVHNREAAEKLTEKYGELNIDYFGEWI